MDLVSTATLAMPTSTYPSGAVWRREREADAGKRGGAILNALALRTVESTQVFRNTSPFAGRRGNEGLGWSVCVGAGFLPVRRHAPATRGARRLPRRGTSSASRHAHATQHGAPYATALGDTSFARSFGPRTSTATSNLRSQKLRKVAHHGTHLRHNPEREPGANRRRGALGGTRTARSVVTGFLSRETTAWPRETEGGCGLRPARIRSSGWCSYVVMQLQKSLWRRLASNKPAERTLKKGGQTRVNGGLARSRCRRVTLSAVASREKASGVGSRRP